LNLYVSKDDSVALSTAVHTLPADNPTKEQDMMTRRDVLVGSMLMSGAAIAQSGGKGGGEPATRGDAFFKNIQWTEVEGRLARAQKADAALRG
jgi:hypothetical protein